MSLFGAMSTAISGLNAQSAAFGNISDNVANSQTVGFKRVDTRFIDYLTTSTPDANNSGAVVARPDYINSVQGTVTQSDNPLALAIAGQGFFQVSQQTGTLSGQPTFSPQQLYTRAGDFKMDKNGYVVNGSGDYLNGWSVAPQTGVVNRNALTPIHVTQTVFNPVATANVTLSANLPATPAAGAVVSSQINVYDGLGTVHTISLDWTQGAPNDWTVSVNSPNDVVAAARGTADVTFGATSGNPVSAGTIGGITLPTGSVTSAGYSAGGPANLSFVTDFGSGPQTIVVDMGTFGASNGVTQFAGTQYSLRGLTQDGVPPGAFASIATRATGDIVVNYDNGQSRTIARVPVTTFNNPDGLQRKDGQAFAVTLESGNPLAEDSNTNGAGNLVTSATESSNVDIASEFSKLIVAQRAYTANTKMVTTADELLQQTIDMKR
jgi:flagellar hook protein FlgE